MKNQGVRRFSLHKHTQRAQTHTRSRYKFFFKRFSLFHLFLFHLFYITPIFVHFLSFGCFAYLFFVFTFSFCFCLLFDKHTLNKPLNFRSTDVKPATLHRYRCSFSYIFHRKNFQEVVLSAAALRTFLFCRLHSVLCPFGWLLQNNSGNMK